MIVSNNMCSVDHIEINGLVREVFGRNAGFLLAADDTLLEAHPCGESSRALLVMGLASAWRDDGREMTVGEAERLLASLCERLDGATMPRSGSSSTISSGESPSPSRSSTSPTRMRMPRTHGRPPYWAGFVVMRLMAPVVVTLPT